MKEIDGFNLAQSEAILSPADVDVIITAGAGSGKTKTLTEKVFRMVRDGIIKPSELLVLTFTNNAAHEMKTRIVKAFNGDAKAQEMLSAHVQTFDSFSQYLVTTYASELGIASSISIANESVIDAKRLSFLDEIFNRRYSDPIQKRRLVESLKKFELRGDSTFKGYVIDLSDYLQHLSPNKRKDFKERYFEKFTGQAFQDALTQKIVEKAKSDIRRVLRQAFFLERHWQLEVGENPSFDDYREAFEDSYAFTCPLESFFFQETELTGPLYRESLKLLELEGRDFIDQALSFEKNHPDLFPAKISYDKEEGKKPYLAYLEMKYLYATKTNTLSYLQFAASDSFNNNPDSFVDDIKLLFELVDELDERLWDYKKSTNSFVFSDVSEMALSLLIEPEFKDIAEKIRSRFQFIMVDEYQDTNDIQELFIDSLSAPRKDGTRAHLFFVGDAKQSIYAFRNSNVALFRKRQASYADGNPGHKVIPMNMNYRSGPGLLNDINYIFSRYMRLDHGAIRFEEPAEQLMYDPKVNIYGKPYDLFGVYRLVSTTGRDDDGVYPPEWECTAIIEDIKKKIADGYPIYDRALKGIRPCVYGDFVILMRKRAQFEYYQQRFQEAGIPLNSSIEVPLLEIDPIILLESLFTLLNAKINHKPCDENHLFASIARSYAYRYDDMYLFRLIRDKEVATDPLMKQIEEFAAAHANDGLMELFPAVLEEFHVVSELYRIGSVGDAMAKIDSCFNLISSLVSCGEGLEEFVALFRNVNKYNLNLSSETAIQSEDAVGLMTIHASKGLEKKVVYMPESCNYMSKPGGKGGLEVDEEYGVMLPDFSVADCNFAPRPAYGVAHTLYKMEHGAEGEIDEHVRLFYVALTRAENAVILVGDDLGKTEDLYCMLKNAPHYEELNEDFVKKAVESGMLSQELLSKHASLNSIRQKASSIAFLSVDGDASKAYEELRKRYLDEKLDERLEDCANEMAVCLFDYYQAKLEQTDDLDLLARVYALYRYSNPNISTLDELNAYIDLRSIIVKQDDDEDADAEDDYQPVSAKELVEFKTAVIGLDVQYLGIKATKKMEEDPNLKKIAVANKALSGLIFGFDGFHQYVRRSFKTSGYADKTMTFDISKVISAPKGINVSMVNFAYSDTVLEFPTITIQKASKSISSEDEEAIKPILEMGTELHRCMEIVDLATKDVSFISNPKYKAMIGKALQMECFQDLEGAEIYKEYGYYDPDLGSMGYVDLMIVRHGQYEIIDYKTSHIDDPSYDLQLRNYARNIGRLFGVDPASIKLTLVSLAQGKTREVKP